MGKLCFFIKERVVNQYLVELEKKKAYEYIYDNKKLTKEQFGKWIEEDKVELFDTVFISETYYDTFKVSHYTD